MKFRNLLLLASLAILVFACSKDDEPKPEPNAAPKIADQSFVASEDVSDSKVIGTVTATDADEDALVFSISTNDNNLFEITEAGALSLASGKSLDFNTAKSHQITVSVSDGEDEATAKVTITVTNVNSSAQMEDQTFEVAEDVDGTTVIGSVQATDEDGDELAFAIVTNDNDLFKITATGDLSLADGKELDFETSETHTLMVGVSDGVDTAAAEITINVTNVNDNAPEMANPQTFNVNENVEDTHVIGAVEASDMDGDELVFSIITDLSNLFEITENGELSLVEGQNLDYESVKTIRITVGVTDGLNEVEAKVDINVENVIENLFEDPNSFITTWQTENDGETVTIYTEAGLTYDYVIDWGDGTVETITTSNDAEHTYTTADTYTVAIQGQFPAIRMAEGGPDSSLTSIDQWGSIQWLELDAAFQGCSELTYNATDAPDLSQVTLLDFMFFQCPKFNGEIGNWDVGNVTSMIAMFGIASEFNGDISNWNVSNVENMSYMFFNATFFNQNIGNWDVSNVENMSYMFSGATSFNQNIGNWDVSHVTNMENMFTGASSFNGDISDWNVSQVTDMWGMFQDANSFNQDISGWNVSAVQTLGRMFDGATSFNQYLGSWDVSGVTDMRSMFEDAVSFDQNLGNWDISSVTAMDWMLDNSGLSMENYEATLIGWAGLNGVPSNITLGATGLTLCGAEAATARAFLDDDKAWTIVGDNSDSCL